MGMFDNVNFTMKCPECGEDMTDFQSKDGHCTLTLLEIEEVDNFYTSCYECGCWVDLTKPYVHTDRDYPPPKTLEDAKALGFVLKHRKKGEKF